MKGTISTEHTIWCGYPNCIESQQEAIATKKSMERFMREFGWRKTSFYGWICPDCAKKMNGE